MSCPPRNFRGVRPSGMYVRLILVAVWLIALGGVAQADERTPLGLSRVAGAADPTARLLEALDRCDPTTKAVAGPRLDVLLALADGRSALELANVLKGPRQCIGHVSTYGTGESELVFIGGVGSIEATGALLWVDRGWWRIVALPLGYMPGTSVVLSRGGTREFFSGINSGGSAGTIGLLGVRIEGSRAAVITRLMPGGEIRPVRVIDQDRVYVEGRLTTDRRLTWNSHPAWPGGAQWILERQRDRFVVAAHRQSLDPDYVWTAFIGALLDGDQVAMSRLATPKAVNDGLALGITYPWITPLQLEAPADFLHRVRMSWDALPALLRTAAPDGPVWGSFSQSDYRGRTLVEARVRFDRAGDGWIISDLSRVRHTDLVAPRLIP